MFKKIVSVIRSLFGRSEKSYEKEDLDFVRRHAPLESASGIKYLLDQVARMDVSEIDYRTSREILIQTHYRTINELVHALTQKVRAIEQGESLHSGSRDEKAVILDDYLSGKEGGSLSLPDSVVRLSHWLMQYCTAIERVEVERNSKLTYYMRLTILEVEDAITFLKVVRSLSIR